MARRAAIVFTIFAIAFPRPVVAAVKTASKSSSPSPASPATVKSTPASPNASSGAPASASATAAQPTFTGRWKLNLERSVLGNLPGIPKARTDSIAHRADEIVQTLFLVLPTGPDTTVYRYRPGGEPTVNRVGGQDITSAVSWEGESLRLRSKTRVMMFDMTLDERWRLSPKRDSLIMTRTVKYPMGEGLQRLVFARE